ncbi:hypothetical protein [Polyangium spumosum]|uniref:Uncharacterized protein n=1 Tax=Polyangium spumosum TaxID=889282 RepID=A0A6N7Q0X7_9BACT|nr:hypothetical protein [Polyangium spumosum]MRG96225.1 hypothetical protein [Polyangium spumosum]
MRIAHVHGLLMLSAVTLVGAGCQNSSKEAPPAPSAAPAKPSAAAPTAAQTQAAPAAPAPPETKAGDTSHATKKLGKPRAKLAGKTLKVEACGLGEHLGNAHMRKAHVDGNGAAYIFTDDSTARQVVPTETGCGLAAGAVIRGNPMALTADGVVVTTDAPKGDCMTTSFHPSFWKGTFLGNNAYLEDGGKLVVETLGEGGCKVAPFKGEKPGGRIASLAATDQHLLMFAFRGSGNDENAVWRFKHDGTLVDKIGLKGDKTLLGWAENVTPCGDGVCVDSLDSKQVFVFDAKGAHVATHKLADVPGGEKLKRLVDIFEIPGHGVYVLAQMKDGANGRDILRLDGMYTK